MVPEGASAKKASKAWRQPTVLPSYDAYKPHQQPTWHHNSKGAVVAPLAVTNSSLIVFKT